MFGSSESFADWWVDVRRPFCRVWGLINDVHGQFAQAFVQYLKPLNQLQADGRVEAPVVRGPAQLLLTTCAFGLGSLKGLPVVTGTPK